MNGMDHQKKIKTEASAGEASRVIHIRSLPVDVNEADIKALGLPFGRVTNVLLMRQKHQAFIELESIENARTMINYFTYVQPTIHTQAIAIQYSQHQELKTRQQDSSRDSRDDDKGGILDSSPGGYPRTVLKVIVTNIVYPVTIEVLQQVFSRCGEIQKIVTFMRNEQYHALIQYASPKEAQSAKTLFNHQNIYNGCNTLQVEFSKLDNLNVKYNNDKSRDFTKPNLGKSPDQLVMDPVAAAQMQMAAMPGMLPNPYTPPLGAAFPGMMGGMHGGMPLGMHQLPPQPHHHQQQQPPFMGMGRDRGSAVLLVSNLSEEDTSCDDLFILFGHYGDVQRVKILFNKKDTALIQFSDSPQAQAAQSNLNGVRLHGKEMRVSRSKHDSVNMPKSEDEGKELTKDYGGSPLHRFKKPGSKNFQNIFPPIRTLHLSNIPESTTEEEIRDLFQEHGGISNFRFFPKDRRMALVQMESIDEALISLMRVHNYKLSESSHLRVSFAKNEM